MKNEDYRNNNDYNFGDVGVSPVIKSYVEDLELFVGHTVAFALGFYVVLLVLLFGVASIFYGQPFTNIDFFGMPIHEAWARTNPELGVVLIILSGILAFVFSTMLSLKYTNRLKSIVLKDCDAYSYLTVVSYAMAKPVRRATDLLYTMSYVEALCLHGRFEEALKFTEPFEHDKKKRVAWLYVRLNLAETKEEFEKYSSEYKRKSDLFKLREFMLNQNYQGVVDYVKEKFKPNMDYNWVYSNYYLAQAYYKLGNKEAAFCAASIAFHGSQYLPHLHVKAFELYKQLNMEVLKHEIPYTVDEFDEKVLTLGEPVDFSGEPVDFPEEPVDFSGDPVDFPEEPVGVPEDSVDFSGEPEDSGEVKELEEESSEVELDPEVELASETELDPETESDSGVTSELDTNSEL